MAECPIVEIICLEVLGAADRTHFFCWEEANSAITGDDRQLGGTEFESQVPSFSGSEVVWEL